MGAVMLGEPGPGCDDVVTLTTRYHHDRFLQTKNDCIIEFLRQNNMHGIGNYRIFQHIDHLN